MTSVLPPNVSSPTDVPTPQTQPASSGNEGRTARFVLIFGVASVVLTVVAIALAVVAPLLSPVSSPLSDGWQKVYDSDSQQFSASVWDESQGCDVTAAGLHAGSQADCTFKPSQNSDLTSKGFVIDATVAPPSAVQSEQSPAIYISNSVFVAVDQMGSYILCVQTCDTTSAAEGNGIVVAGQADDWHSATDVANTIAIRVTVSGTTNTLQFFTNGQYVTSIDVSSASLFAADFALGADDQSEALFTHVAIYSASA